MTAKDARRRADRRQSARSAQGSARRIQPATMTLPARPSGDDPCPAPASPAPPRPPSGRRSATPWHGPGTRPSAGGAARDRGRGRAAGASPSSGPRTRRSAISRPTSRCSSRGRCGGRRWTSPRRSPRRSATGPDGALIASADVARPGFVNLRLADSRSRRPSPASSPPPGSWGRFQPDQRARRRRRVRVGQPDRAAAHRQRPRCVRRRPPEPRARGRRPAGDARVLLQRLRRPGAQARRVGARDPERRAGAGRRLPRRVRGGPRGRGARRRRGRRGRAGRRRRGGRSGAGPPSGSAPGIEASLERLGVHFDVWKSEGSLHSEGWVDRAIERLRAGGHLYEQDGALWFRSTTFGDDKDRVLIRSTGEPTYFAADVGYVVEKLSRGFDHLIYIWGVDHHGYIARTRGAPPRPWASTPPASRSCSPAGCRSCAGAGRRDVEAGRRHLPAGHAPGRDRQRRGPLVLRVTRHAARHRGRRGPGPPPVVREPRLLRPVRPRADRLDPAQGRRRRPGAGARRRGPALRRARGAARAGDRAATPRSSRTPSRPRRPRGSPPTRPSWRPSSTPSIATRASWTRSSRSGRRSGSRWRSRR